MSKCKRWVFTSYNVESEPSYQPALHEYLVYGRETCSTTNRRHLQGFVVFKNRKNFCTVKAWLPGAHFERARGTLAEASTYCKKDGDYVEFGSLPEPAGKLNPFRDALHKAEIGDLAYIKDSYPGIYLRYKATLLSCQSFDDSCLGNSSGIWICGPPRCGKDYAVRHYTPLYVKSLNKWWDGYRGQPNVLLSDVDLSHCNWLGSFLKIWADMYPFNAEIKGGTIFIRPKRLFVTSNYTLQECFSDKILDALVARFDVYDFFGEEPVYTKRLTPTPNTTVLDMLSKNEALAKNETESEEVTSTSSNDKEEEGEVVERPVESAPRSVSFVESLSASTVVCRGDACACVEPSDSGDEFDPPAKRHR